MNTGRQLATLEPQMEQTRAEHRRFKAFLTEKRHQEMIRDSLVAQIDVIRSMDGDRCVCSHLLDEVTRALPAYTWLTDLGADVATTPGVAPSPAAAAAPANADSNAAPAK